MEEAVRYTRYGDDEPPYDDRPEAVVDAPAEARARVVEEYGPFLPSHPPLLGPTPPHPFTGHPHEAALGHIMGRLAIHYLTLFTLLPPHQLDLFFTAYPDCMAECLYHSFVQLYPLCTKLLDTPLFRRAVSQLVAWVCSGYAPADAAWERWRIGGKVEERRRNSCIRGARRQRGTRFPPLSPPPPPSS